MVVDDYGHHPTEIRTTLEALRTRAGSRRTVVLFQPHRYSRTRDLFERFLTAFYAADRVVVTDIYPAGEQPLPEVSAQALAEGGLGDEDRYGQDGILVVQQETAAVHPAILRVDEAVE